MIDRETGAQPLQGPLDGRVVRLAHAAAVDPLAADFHVGRLDHVVGDYQAGNAGTSHAPGPGEARAHVISEGAVGVLTLFPIPLGGLPDLALDRHAGPLRFVEGQQGELAVGIVAASLGIGPGPGDVPGAELLPLQPRHVALDGRQVAGLPRPAEDHRL